MDAPAPNESSPAISDATRRRMAELERTRPEPEHPIRHAIGFVLGVGALAALVDYYAPWEDD
ncbi:MAG: hypothetical protein R3343_11420 [Nitriliruptorales bacterium]|nr:hypothetical protein [Nitriliruptorales bacterium]